MKALARSGRVDMLHVTPPADFQTLGGVADRIRDEHRREAEALLDQLMSDCQERYGIRPGAVLKEGMVGEEIIAAATSDSDVIMVVIGTAHNLSARGTLATWLAGQLGTKLPIPLLMVPGNLTQQQLSQLV
jgi:hypothetical protein